MNDLDAAAFTQLFKDAYEKCFGYPLNAPVTETESKLLSNQVLDETGLVIGFKSVKNYSAYIFNSSAAKQENPSISTLDTLSRYVLNAPLTDEAKRKKNESHYPYWFAYKEKFHRASAPPATPAKTTANWKVVSSVVVIVIIALSLAIYFFRVPKKTFFSDNFNTTDTDSLAKRGWFVKWMDTAYWNRRGENAGCLTLFTLKGDNWPDSGHQPGIKNLLLRKVEDDCFTAEMHLQKFIPQQNWQQAGLILMEDTGFTGKSIRLTIAYNDYYGPYPKTKQVIVQAITSLGKGFGKPEEIAHSVIAYPDSITKNPAFLTDMENAALRMEKHGTTFRLLYAGGKMANSAFREVVSQAFDMQPKYIGLFALRGFTDSTAAMPVHVNFFKITGENCGN